VKIALRALVLAAAAPSVLAAQSFDWDRYHERQDACRDLDQAQRACATYGLAACDQAAIERLQRQCSAFGPLGDKRLR
jgi:hypothetical protein